MSDKIRMSWEGRAKYYTEKILPVCLRPVLEKSLHGEANENMIIEGDNLPVMTSLMGGAYNLRGRIDLLLWDPPYNTGNKDFRYNDSFSLSASEVREARQGVDLASAEDGWVSILDPSRHTKWLNFMASRLWAGKKLLKESGVIAVCIDGRELFRLGLLMDEIFGEENRLGLINWQKVYVAKADAKHISDATEYVLIYEKVEGHARRQGLFPQSTAAAEKYANPDDDPYGDWVSLNPKAKTYSAKADYGIMSPFTGEMWYPENRQSWRHKRANMLAWLQDWGVEYEEVPDSRTPSPSLVLKGAVEMMGRFDVPPAVLESARETAQARLKAGNWPKIIFLKGGQGSPMIKKHLRDIQVGRVPMSFFREEEYMFPLSLGTQSWNHEESGHNKGAREMLNAIMGSDHDFATPKPLQLMEKLIHLYCPPSGTVLDAFGGAGTTAHAVLSLNNEIGTNRRFIVIENGNGDDQYCDTLTAERVRRVATGKWATGPRPALEGGFTYYRSAGTISRASILTAKREELVDMILQSIEEGSGKCDFRISHPELKHLVGRTRRGQGVALVWSDGASVLTSTILNEIKAEATSLGLSVPVYVYAMVNQGPNGSDAYTFCQLPDTILSSLGELS